MGEQKPFQQRPLIFDLKLMKGTVELTKHFVTFGPIPETGLNFGKGFVAVGKTGSGMLRLFFQDLIDRAVGVMLKDRKILVDPPTDSPRKNIVALGQIVVQSWFVPKLSDLNMSRMVPTQPFLDRADRLKIARFV
jgi:hypothetical protein